jgi:hypothetical protein
MTRWIEEGITSTAGSVTRFQAAVAIRAIPARISARFVATIDRRPTRNGEFEGLHARLQAKLAAHAVRVYPNRLLGSASFLEMESLAFPR